MKSKLLNPMGELYAEAGLSGSLRRSMNAILMGNLFGTVCGIICGSGTTAMVGLATSLGANDLFFGIITAITQVAALLQIPFSILVNRTHQRKRYMLTFGLGSRVLWLLFGFVPLIIPDLGGVINLRLWTLIFLTGLISAGNALINVCWFPWFSDISPISIRSRWLSMRDAINQTCSVVFGLVVAFLLDHLPEESRYIIIFLIGGTCGVIDMVCFAFCEEKFNAAPRKQTILGVFKDVFGNRRFRRFLITWTVWAFAVNFGAVYMNPYNMNEIGLTYMQMMVFGTIAAALSIIMMEPRWGKAIFRFGCKPVMRVCMFVEAVIPLVYLFSVKGSFVPMLLMNLLGAMFWCGNNLCANNMQLNYSPDETRASYIAVFACVTALLGTTLGSLAGGALLDYWKEIGLFTGYFDRYKMIFLCSSVMRLLVWIFLMPRLENDSRFAAGDVLKGMVAVRSRRDK
ncbi:MAG: MFS transporter [Firmicutes bacterium]|nr:MFS transporter [Bacillota bacterium]